MTVATTDATETPVPEGAQGSTGRRATPHRVVLALCVCAVLGFYVRCAWTYGKDLDPAPQRVDFQNRLADAFLHGQLNLRLEVPAGLTALPDPYDSVANEQYRSAGLHDLTFYKGKIYAYFGPAPVLLLFVPFRLLRVGDLSPTLACLIFSVGGFFASVGVFLTMTRRFLRPLSTGGEALAVVALGFAAPVGWLISIGRGYEVPISCGYFLVFSGLYFLTRGLFAAPARPIANLALGSFLLAGAVGARPNLFWLFGFVVFALAYLRWGDDRRAIPRSTWIALLAPYAAVALALAWYNWARFDSVSEFGTTYMLLGENGRLARANELGFLRRGLFEYLLSPARRKPGFPGLRLRPPSFPLPTEANYIKEPIAGLLPNMPASVLGIVGIFASRKALAPRRRWLTLFAATVAGVGFIIVAVSSFHFHSV